MVFGGIDIDIDFDIDILENTIFFLYFLFL